MSPRRTRLKKLAFHRERQLDRTVTELAKKRQAEKDARSELNSERERVASALQVRDELADAVKDVRDWQDANEWLLSREAAAHKARAKAARAEVERQRAQGHVKVAHRELHKMQMLDERMRRQEEQIEAKQEQRLLDEVALRRFQSRGAGKWGR